MADNPKLPDNSKLREARNLINDILNSSKAREAVENNITKSQTDSQQIQKDLNRLLIESAEYYDGIVKDLDTTEKLQKNINKLRGTERYIIDKINSSSGKTKEIYIDALATVKKTNKTFTNQLKVAKKLDDVGGGFQFLAQLSDKVPILNKLAEPFARASKAARGTAKGQLEANKNLKSTSSRFQRLNAGRKGFSRGITDIFKKAGPLGIGLTIITSIVKAFTAADQRATNLAKSLGIAKSNARGILKEFSKIQSSNLLVNLDNLAESVGQLTEGLGATAIQSKSTLENQIFLNKNLGLSAEQASKLSILGDSFNISSRKATDNVIEMSDELSKTNGFLIPVKNLLGEIANLSAEIQGYFGFSTKELASAVYQTRRFGVSLSTANNIASSLLDFETSIKNELQLELLTNRSLNFERARSLAFTGDIAGATAEVLRQTQNLTEAQRRNPLILKAAAEASGISAEELNKAFLIQKRLNIGADEYNRLLEKGSNLVGFERASVLMMQSGSREQFEQTLSVQEKLNAAITRVTDQFQTLVDNGAIDAFIDGVAAFVGALGSGRGIFGAMSAFKSASKETKIKFQQGKSSEQLNDFTIRANPKDTLVMAGGTKFGEETNALLRELITAVNAGGDVYMSGTKVGRHVFGNLTKQS